MRTVYDLKQKTADGKEVTIRTYKIKSNAEGIAKQHGYYVKPRRVKKM